MSEFPVSGAYAEYHGRRFRIAFSGNDWVAIAADRSADLPDAIEHGVSQPGSLYETAWVKVPRSCLDGIVDVEVTGLISGHRLWIRNRLVDGRIRVWFIGDPKVASDTGLKGDQLDGWTGFFSPGDFQDFQVKETRR